MTVPTATKPRIRPRTISPARTGFVTIVWIVLFLISVGQAEGTQEERHQQHQVGGRREDKADVELRRIRAVGAQEPTGKQQDHQKKYHRNPDATAPRFLDRQVGKGHDTSRGDRQHFTGRGPDHLIDHVTGPFIGPWRIAVISSPASSARIARLAMTTKNHGSAPN